MKIRLALIVISGITLLVMAAPHVWTFKQGGTIEGDYYTSGTAAVVIRRDGTNCILPIANLSSNDLAFVAQKKIEQRKAQLAAETNLFLKRGMVELSKQRIQNFPEQVNDRFGWMDCEFSEFDIDSSPVGKLAGADFMLRLVVKDKDSNYYRHAEILKRLPTANAEQGPANPTALQAAKLKQVDRIRLIGMVANAGDNNFESFMVDRIEIIETATEKKAREQAAEQATEQTLPALDPSTGLLIHK